MILYLATQRKKVTSLYYCVYSVSFVRCRRSLTSLQKASKYPINTERRLNTYFDNLPPNDLVGVHVARSLCMIEQEKQDSIFSHNQSVQFETTKPGDEMVGEEVAWGRSDCNSCCQSLLPAFTPALRLSAAVCFTPSFVVFIIGRGEFCDRRNPSVFVNSFVVIRGDSSVSVDTCDH